MTYKEFIQNILDTRGRFACGDEYHERHHILPKCMGGTNDEENLIDLYAREHFIAHRLLALENPENNSLVYAWNCMAFSKRDYQKRYELTPEEYEEARKAFSKALTGHPTSDETKQKISEANKGRTYSEETRKKMSDAQKQYFAHHEHPLKGKSLSQEAIEKIRQSKIGRRSSDETREKMSKSQKKRFAKLDVNPLRGRHLLNETKQKISEANKGRKLSEEQKRKLSEIAKNRIVSEGDKDRLRNLGKKNSRPIICIDTEIVYQSTMDAERRTGIPNGNINRACKNGGIAGGYHWKYIYDYILKNNTVIQGAITLGIISEEEVVKQFNKI